MAEYDFIIIGAGSAGSVVANRLSELRDWNVLLIEAGGDESMSGQIPALAAGLQLTNVDWRHKTTVPHNGACRAFNNQQLITCSFNFYLHFLTHLNVIFKNQMQLAFGKNVGRLIID